MHTELMEKIILRWTQQLTELSNSDSKTVKFEYSDCVYPPEPMVWFYFRAVGNVSVDIPMGMSCDPEIDTACSLMRFIWDCHDGKAPQSVEIINYLNSDKTAWAKWNFSCVKKGEISLNFQIKPINSPEISEDTYTLSSENLLDMARSINNCCSCFG